MSRNAGQVLRRATSEELDSSLEPTLDQLTESLMFSPGDGRIWLNDHRVFLMHTASFGDLRHELIESLGTDKTRELFTRIGYATGARDAELIRRRWPDGDLASTFHAGPRLHALEGVVKVTTIRFEFDVDKATFYGEFLWHDSTEAVEHVRTCGLSSIPTCWMQLGYASGYASAFMGKLIIYREVECHAISGTHCRIIGRPADEWDDIEEELRYFQVENTKGPKSESAPVENTGFSDTRPTKNAGLQTMVGSSSAFRAAHHMLERVAPTDATVLFLGESGTGKELFATALQKLSARNDGPFIAVNCAAIPDTLVESELFGVERGAYTGANASRPGRFERASGGTLFLDEVGSLSKVAQGKLLRALQEGEVERVGGTKLIKVDVRVAAATNIDLRILVEQGLFREDLFFRLNVFPIELPPLRERRDDIPLLMDHFLQHYSIRHKREIKGFTRRATQALLDYDFHGNIRELQNLIERGVIFADDGSTIDSVHLFRRGELQATRVFSVNADGSVRRKDDAATDSGTDLQRPESQPERFNTGAPKAPLPTEPADPAALARAALDGHLSIDEVVSRTYVEALARTNGNLSAAARLLGLTRPQLEYRLKKLEAV